MYPVSVAYQLISCNLQFVVQGGIYSYFSHKTTLGLYLIHYLKTFQKVDTCMSNIFFLSSDVAANILNFLVFLAIIKTSENFYIIILYQYTWNNL